MILSNAELRAALTGVGTPYSSVWPLADVTYMPPRSDWLPDFHQWYFKALQAFAIRDYVAETQDCDDFASLFAALARIAHARTPEGRGHALPVGRYDYARRPNTNDPQWHAIVWVYTSDKGLVWLEPQTLYQAVNLTVPQIQSCIRCSE